METRLQRIEQVYRKFRVKTLYVFGSRSAEVFQAIQDDRLDNRPSQSDLDIGVLTQPALSVDEKVSLTLALEEIFDVQRVDLVPRFITSIRMGMKFIMSLSFIYRVNGSAK